MEPGVSFINLSGVFDAETPCDQASFEKDRGRLQSRLLSFFAQKPKSGGRSEDKEYIRGILLRISEREVCK